MKISTELEILIESIKVSLLEKPSNRLIYLLENQSVNWNRFEKMATYHSIRPVVYDAFRKINFEKIPPNYLKLLKDFFQQQALLNLLFSKESDHLDSVFKQNQIKNIGFKGLFWQNNFYQKPLRESKDIDVLIEKESVLKVCELLTTHGYQLKIRENGNQVKLSDLINQIQERGDIEITFIKKVYGDFDIEIDLHWDVSMAYLPYNLKIESLFLPSEYTNLWLLVLHNGGREGWGKLKYIVDFLVFQKKYQNKLDWNEINDFAIKFGLKTILQTVLYFSNTVFNLDILHQKPIFNKKTFNAIISFWENSGRYEEKINARINFEYLKINLQDKPFSRFKYFWRIIRFQSLPNESVKDRYFMFNRKYSFLNFMSKLLTVIFK